MPRWAAAPVHPPSSRSASATGIGRHSHTTPTSVCGRTPHRAKRPVYSSASAWLFRLPLAHRRSTLDVFNHVSTFLFTSWLIAVKQCIVSVTHAARFTVASAWRVKYTSIATHHSTSCIQNSRRQSVHFLRMFEHPPPSFLCEGEITAGHTLNTSLSYI